MWFCVSVCVNVFAYVHAHEFVYMQALLIAVTFLSPSMSVLAAVM